MGRASDGAICMNDHSDERGGDSARVQGRSPAVFAFTHQGGDNRSRASPLGEIC
jgi:hypothetical protein